MAAVQQGERDLPRAGGALHTAKCMPLGNSKVARELSPSRVYRKEIDYHRLQVPPLFRGGQQIRLLGHASDGGRVSDGSEAPKPPQLLDQVEALLSKKLAAANEKAQRYGPVQSGWAASMLRLDAYRQSFDILINSMTTYKPILRQIRKHYDAALENAVKTSFDNMHLRSEISIAESKKQKAVDDTLAECAKNALVLRDQLFAQLTDAQVLAEKAEGEAKAAEASAQDAKQELRLLNARVTELTLENQRLLDNMLDHTSWKPREGRPDDCSLVPSTQP